MRNDTPYWKEVSGNVAYSRSMSSVTNLAGLNHNVHSSSDLGIRLHRSRQFDANMGGIIYIAAGMGYNPVEPNFIRHEDKRMMETPDIRRPIYNNWLKHKEEVLAHIETLPTHYEFLKTNIHK